MQKAALFSKQEFFMNELDDLLIEARLENGSVIYHRAFSYIKPQRVCNQSVGFMNKAR